MANGVNQYINSQPDHVRPLLQAARTFLHASAPGLTEAMKWRVPTFMHGRNLFYLNAQADHVVLGFCNGAKMEEFRGVFDAVLAEVAHVRIRTADDLRRPGLREAVRSAAGFREERDFADRLHSRPAEAAGLVRGTAPGSERDADASMA